VGRRRTLDDSNLYILIVLFELSLLLAAEDGDDEVHQALAAQPRYD